MTGDLFIDLCLIIILATVICGFMRLLKQPLLIGYLLTGIIASFFGIVPSGESLKLFSHIGVALLLFVIGLSLNPKIIRDLSKPSLITGIGQFVISTMLGYIICIYFGFTAITSLYIAVALSFSSTIVAMKILSDKRDTETLYGYLSTGYLIIQDLIVIVILMIITSLSSGVGIINIAFETILKGVGLVTILFLIGIYILPKITELVAKSQEYLLLFSLGWCFALSVLFYYMNFSIETGALIAGITLSMSSFRYEISSKMKPIRDFFIILFFIAIGSQITLGSINQYLTIILSLSLLILFIKPLIIISLLGFLGYARRTSFLTGATCGNISEFSIIMIALGISRGILPSEILSVITIIGFITIGGSSYLMLYSNQLYSYLSRYLKIFEKRNRRIDAKHRYKESDYEIILFGYNRIGYDILESLKKIKKKYLVVDYNPVIIRKLTRESIDCRYGDANDYELLEDLRLSEAKMVISTIPDYDTNAVLIKKIRETNKDAIIIVVSHNIDQAIDLYEIGATYVITPHLLGGHHASMMIEEYGFDMKKFLKEKLNHIEDLNRRRELGHNKPKHERR